MRLLDAIGRSILAITVGALVVGHAFVVPLLTADSPLLDANLARAIAGPIELRIADVVVFGALLTACVVPRWTDRHVATTLGLVAVALAGLDRLMILPRLHQAWAQVDLVALRPANRLEEAQTLATQHYWIVLGVGACLVAVSVLAELARSPSADEARRRALLAMDRSKPTPLTTPADGSSPAPA